MYVKPESTTTCSMSGFISYFDVGSSISLGQGVETLDERSQAKKKIYSFIIRIEGQHHMSKVFGTTWQGWSEGMPI